MSGIVPYPRRVSHPPEYWKTCKILMTAVAFQELVIPLPADSLFTFRANATIHLPKFGFRFSWVNPTFPIRHAKTNRTLRLERFAD